MKPIKIILLATLALGLSACAKNGSVSRNESINAPFVGTKSVETIIAATTFSVRNVRVSVPDSLSVSEANIYYPTADIVWREGVFGDRHEQVAVIFEEGMAHGVKDMNGAQAINVNVEVKRFHSLTERARYTIGGVHSIKFILALTDAKTGVLIAKPRLINADLKAYGGKRAVQAEHRGETQRVRITAHLAEVITREIITIQNELKSEANDAVAELPVIRPNAI